MKLEEEIIDRFKDCGFYQGGELYLKARDSIRFIKSCQAHNLAIIGVEVFTIKNEEVYPRIDLIADFSEILILNWDKYVKDCNNQSQKFIQNLELSYDNSLYFNLTILAEDDL